ncbi:MAG: porin family protein [Candidatus Limimorpha sp.]
MKKFLLLFAVVLLFNTVKAEGFDICIGPKIGYQTAKLSMKKEDIQASYKANFTAGVFGRVTIGRFIIQPEINYFKTGQVFEIKGTSSLLDFNPKLEMNEQTMSVPIYLGFQVLDTKLIKVRANAGPVMNFILKQTSEVSFANNNTDLDLKAKNMLWSGAVMVGVDVWRFTLDISYNFGLTKFFESEEFEIQGYNMELENPKQNMFTATVGFKLL